MIQIAGCVFIPEPHMHCNYKGFPGLDLWNPAIDIILYVEYISGIVRG